MVKDFDDPSKGADSSTDSIEILKDTENSANVDVDQSDGVHGFDLPPEVLDADLETVIIPTRPDEFTCTSCFLIKNRSHLSSGQTPKDYICVDCI